MDQRISAAEANRKFSSLLREVRDGESFVVTSHGVEVARIVPVDRAEAARKAAFARLLSHLDAQEVTDIGRWKREDIYER